MEKEITYKGISSSPDEYRCEDGQLSVCQGLRNDDGSWRLALSSTVVGTLNADERIMYVHETQDGCKNYIVSDSVSLSWRQSLEGTMEGVITTRSVTSITAVGNVLCIATEEGLVYAVWRGGTYVIAESPLWRPKAQFCLQGNWTMQEDEGVVWTKILYTDKNSDGSLIAMQAMSVSGSDTGTLKVDATGLNLAADTVWGYKIEGIGDRANSYDLTVNYTVTVYYSDGTTEKITPSASWGNSAQNYAYVTAKKVIERLYVSCTVKNNDSRNAVNVAFKISDFGADGWMRFDSTGVDAVKARVNAFRKDAGEKHKFLDPFFAQIGARMYDGNVVAMGPPCLMVPSSDVSPMVCPLNALGGINGTQGPDYYTKEVDGEKYRGFRSVTAAMSCDLRCRITNINDADSNLYQSLVIAVSEPVRLCNAEEKDGYTFRKMSSDDGGVAYLFVGKENLYDRYIERMISVGSRGTRYIVNQPRRNDVEDALLRASSTLYIVQEIPLQDAPTQDVWMDVDMTDVDMDALSSREKMSTDSSYLETLCGGSIYAYNSRLHVGGYSARLFEGYGAHEMNGVVSIGTNTAVTTVEMTEDGTACAVRSSESGLVTASLWFFYPRISASRAVVTRGGKTYEIALKKHPYRSGSYWFGGFDVMPENSGAAAGAGGDVVSKRNAVRVSEANNPFLMNNSSVFNFRSEVVRMASAVTALSTGQMGQFDLYVLTRGDGVWSLKMSDEGKYLRQVPVTRDAILDDGGSLCQVDGSVVFATDMGVMELSGSKSACLSNDVAERVESVGAEANSYVSDVVTLREYLRGCRVVYDYAGQRLIVGNEEYDYAFVRSLRTGLWSMESLRLKYALNSYPEAVVAVEGVGGDVIMQLSADNTSGSETGAVRIVTRALKIDDSNRFKKVTHVRQNGIVSDEDSVRQRLWGSNDLRHWNLVASASGMRLTVAAGGSGYRFYQIAVDAVMTGTDFLSGATVEFAYRDNDKLM